MNIELKSQAKSGLKWGIISRFAKQFATFVVSIILARILSPSDYGLIGMLALFVLLSDAIIESGYGSAIIQKKVVTDAEYSSVFYYNAIASVILYLLFYTISGAIAKFFEEPILEDIIKLYFVVFVINSFRIVPQSILSREMKIKIVELYQLYAALISGGIAVVLAVLGFGVWSLVVKEVVFSFIVALLIIARKKWRPGKFVLYGIGGVSGYGIRMFTSRILDLVASRIDSVLIGKIFDATTLGYYTRANGIRALPTKHTQAVAGKISFLLFSRIDDEEEYNKYYVKVKEFVAIATIPALVYLSVAARDFVVVVYGEVWVNSVDYVSLLCLQAVFTPISAVAVNVLASKGYAGKYLKLEIIKKIVWFIAAIIGIQAGIISYLFLMIAAAMIGYIINLYMVRTVAKLGILRQLAALKSSLVISCFIVLVQSIIKFINIMPELRLVLSLIVIIVGSYAIFTFVMKAEWIEYKHQILTVLHEK